MPDGETPVTDVSSASDVPGVDASPAALEARIAASEAEIADITVQLRRLLDTTVPAFQGRVSRHRGEIEGFKSRVGQLTDDLRRTRHERRTARDTHQEQRRAMDDRLNRHRGDIEWLKGRRSVDAVTVDPLLDELHTLHDGVSPVMSDLKKLADGTSDDQQRLRRVDVHASALVDLRDHLLDLQHRATVLEQRVGQRLRLAQTDPRVLIDSCQDHIATLNMRDDQWRSLFAGFRDELSRRDRLLSDGLTVNFPVISLALLQELSQTGFLPKEYIDIVQEYRHAIARGGVREYQEILTRLIFVASKYPEMIWERLKNVFEGKYVTIDQDLLGMFSHHVNAFLRDTVGLDYVVAIGGDPTHIYDIPASHAPMHYALGISLPGASLPSRHQPFLSSGFVFHAPDDDANVARPCPPGIRIVDEVPVLDLP